MIKFSYYIVLATFLLLFSCTQQEETPKTIPNTVPDTLPQYTPLLTGTMYVVPVEMNRINQDSNSISYEALSNSFISHPDYGKFKLRKGKYENGTLSDVNYINAWFVSGFVNVDVDNDGDKDAIGSLCVNTGGSGCFTSMDVFINANGNAKHIASYTIGDRESVDSLKISGNTFEAFFTVHGKDDSMAEPTQHMRKKFKLDNQYLIEMEELRY